MILEDALLKHGYARLLIADHHMEYPLNAVSGARVMVAWNPFEVEEVFSRISHIIDPDIEPISKQLFGALEKNYNGYWDTNMNLWIVQGSIPQLYHVFRDLASQLAFGASGDDDVFDYWPNAADMLCAMADDILKLIRDYEAGSVRTDGPRHSYYRDKVLKDLRVVIVGATAVMGDPKEWEAESHFNAMANIISREEDA